MPTFVDRLRHLLGGNSTQYDTPIHRCLADLTQDLEVVSFLQVGVCFGAADDPNDPLFPFLTAAPGRWRGVLIDPLPYCRDVLRQTYANNPHIRVKQAAVDVVAGTRSLYRVAYERGEPIESYRGPERWMDALARFDRESLVELLHHPKFASMCATRGSTLMPSAWHESVEEISVCTITMDEACALAGQPSVVVIDTEGHDARLIRSMNLSDGSCKVVVFEHVGLTPQEKHDVVHDLRAQGFRLLQAFGDDAVAVRDT